MSETIDCLIAAYSGMDRNTEKYKKLIKKNSDIAKIPIPLNAAITYLGTALNKKNLTFDFINSIEDNIQLLLYKLRNEKILCVAISTTLCSNIYQLKELIDNIKNISKDIKIILGGALIVNYIRTLRGKDNNVFRYCMRSFEADYIIDSVYGEEKLAELVYAIKFKQSTENIPNIYQYIKNSFILSLNEDEEYNLASSKIQWGLFKGRTGNTISIRTSVSCLFSCSFCSYPIRAGKYQSLEVKQIEDMLDEIEDLKEVKLIHFIDDTFNVPLKRFKDILRMIIRKKYRFRWHSYLRCQSLDEEAVKLMKQSGCIGVFLGLESGSNSVLQAMNKKVNICQYRKGIELLKKYRITIIASFFGGFPGETLETLNETQDFIEETKPDFYYLGPWIYDIRTPIYEHREEYELTGIQNNWKHKTMSSELVSQIIERMKKEIKHATLVQGIDYPFLFQIISSDITVESLKRYLK